MINIFFIGKNDAFQDLLTLSLKQQGIKVIQLLSPEDEFNLWDAEIADLIVADVEEKGYGLECYEILEVIREILKDKKFVGFTKRYSKQAAERVKELGAMGYFYIDVDDIKSVSHCIKAVYQGEPYFNAYDKTYEK